ncbi:cysteinyl-tRNA synthetase [Mortierella antarctica]|nr:cysteinyl-tRNA synthetase [Mortierella antarctica]
MAPLQPAPGEDRKSSTDSPSSSFRAASSMEQAANVNYGDAGTRPPGGNERRPSTGSASFAPLNGHFGYGRPSSPSTFASHSHSPPMEEQQHQQQRPRNNSHNGRTHLFHPLDALAQTPLMVPGPSAGSDSPSSGRRKNNAKDGGDSGVFRSFFRSSSRPPSPTPFADPADSYHNSSGTHTRKTSFGSYKTPNPMNTSSSTMAGSPSTLHSSGGSTLYSSYSSSYFQSSGVPSYGSSSTGNLNSNHSASALYQQRPAPHPFSPDSGRRRSTESYSRSPSPEGRRLPPATPPSQGRPQQITGPRRNGTEPAHRRTKSSDFGEMYSKRPGLPQELVDLQATVSSAPKEARDGKESKEGKEGKEGKKTLFSIFKKKASNPPTSSPAPSVPASYNYHSSEYGTRKYSADDPLLPLSPPSTSSLHSLALLSDQDASSQVYSYDRRHGSDGGDSLRHLPPFSIGKKSSRKDVLAQELVLPGYVDLGDLSGLTALKDFPKNGSWLPLSSTGNSAEAWLAPESWGPLQKSLSLTPEDVTSDEMEQSDYESWDYGKKKLSTIRIFRPDTTYTTVNCVYSISTSELHALLGRKIFKPDTSKYHVYVLRNNIVRPLAPNEKPLNILRRCLLQFGYTDQDKLDELSGKDNSFLCRFTFAENGVPSITEADFPPHSNHTDVNLQRRCLPTIPIFLHLIAKDIVRLNISNNQRMDLPLDFIQNCSALRDLRMAFNDLERIPSNVRFIVHLQVLDVRGNRIRDLDKARLDEARKLDTLILQCNRLVSVPDSFASFEYLRIINLSSNNFSKFPVVLCQVTSLEELDLSFNDIAEVPDEISKLFRLKKLLLYGNRIGPFLPKSMESLSRLRKLDIRQNGILNLDALNDLPALEELLVDYNTNVVLNNSFGALVWASIVKCNMPELNLRGTGDTLTILDVSSNKLTNLAPSLFDHLRSLETLKLDNNSISSIPATIGALKKLRTLSIANNNVSSIPDEIALLDSLIELDVHSNSLGELPAAIWRCALEYLNASSNLLESFPDPPEAITAASTNGLATAPCDFDTQAISAASKSTSSFQHSKPLPAPPVPTQSLPPNVRPPHPAPLANSLLTLCLGDNRLPDDIFYPLSLLCSLEVLNLSHNFIAEIPRGKLPNPGSLQELYLSGNQLTNLPADDIESLRNLQILHVSGNKLTTLPAELGKINRLGVLDVGCNMLKYNISNWPYDWNWNWNLELKYLNMSGNKRLQIKRQTVESVPTASRPGNLSEFGSLTCLRILGLMDVTITDNVPDDTVERRVRTSTSTLHNMSYGMADTLGKGENLCIWDLVHPKFQTKDDEVLFGLFDGRSGQSSASCKMTSQLKDRFGAFFKIELEKLEGSDTVVSALRRTFLGLDRELWPITQNEEGRGGASALVAYIKGVTLYSANVGDTIAVLVKKSDSFQVISQKHIPWNPTEAARIKRSGGFVSEKGLLNDELDLSRSFGQYHLVPIVNSNPYIETTTLTEDDDFIIMASKSFWDFMSYATAVDIAKAGMRIYGDLMYASQKLRDIAISYGAHEHMVVMLIGVGDLFKKKEPLDASEYHQHKKRPKPTEGPVDALKYLKPEIEPPQGDVAMVFTDIKNSTKLWEDIPIAMGIAIKEHFNIMRRQLRSIGGYEVKNEGDAMMASFSSVPAAVLWCFKVQELLVMADWPQDILDSADGKTIFHAADPNQPMYRGLSVRMGIHWGQPVSHRDEVTRRMDYYGSMVNRAARICASADGGEICVSSDVMSVVQQLFQLADLQSLDQSESPHADHLRELKKLGFGVIDIGEKKLKGLETPESLHLLYTRMLAGRFAMDPSTGMLGTPVVGSQEMAEKTMALDPVSVRSLQTICLRLERLASGAVAKHGRASEQSHSLISLAIKDNADQDDLVRIAESCISRIENCFSQLYMAKSGQFVEVFESLGKALNDDSSYILRALQMYVNIMGGLDSPALL